MRTICTCVQYVHIHTHVCCMYIRICMYVQYMLTCVITGSSRSPMILYRRYNQQAEGAAETTGEQNGPVCRGAGEDEGGGVGKRV